MASIDLDLTDIFDNLCDIKQNSAASNAYGHPQTVASVVVAAAVPCKLLPDIRRGTQPPVDPQAVRSRYILYLNPINGVTFTENLWVFVNGNRYKISEIIEPVIDGAPYEFRMERVKS